MRAIVFARTGSPEVRPFGLAAAAAAHRHLESRQSTGKLVLLP